MNKDPNISPNRFFIILIFSILLTEMLIMFLFFYLHLDPIPEIFLDSFILIVVISPILFFFSFRPLISQMKKTEQIKNELEINQNQLTRQKADLITKTEQIERQNKELEERQAATLNILEDLNLEKANLEETKVKDEAFLRSIGEGVVVTDPAGKVILVNKVVTDFLHYDPKEIIGRVWAKDFPRVEDGQGHEASYEQTPVYLALHNQGTSSKKLWYVNANNEVIPVVVTASSVIINGQNQGAVVVFRDVTKEEELDRAKSEFISLASHQLRTPLGISKWYLEALKDDDLIHKDAQVAKDYLDEIYTSNERLIKLVGDLLNVSRIEQSKVRNEPELTDISEFIKVLLKQLEVEAKKKQIRISLSDKTESLLKINIDQEKFREVLENLISNAIKYTDQSGQVEITISYSGNKLQIDIKDNGMGIAKEDQPKIFTRFFRTAEAVKKDTSGAGLGLYIVKSYIEGWGGKIWFESEKGKGTTFHFSLPTQT